MEKNKRVINSYLNKKHHGIKQTNLCRCEIYLRVLPTKNIRIETQNLDGNLTGNADKKTTTTTKNDKREEERWNRFKRKRKTTQQLKQNIKLEEINKKALAKEGSLKRYRDKIKQYKQNRTFKKKKEKEKSRSK